MTALAFTVPGEVRGKGRPRLSARGGIARAYTDAKTVNYETAVKFAAHEALAGALPLAGPLCVQVRARIAPVASASKRDRAAMLAGDLRPTKKPDIDNVVKSILDGCNGVAFADDSQVVELRVIKIYADTSGVDVFIRPTTHAGPGPV